MAKVNSSERFNDFAAWGIFGRGWEYGARMFGADRYGEEEVQYILCGYGASVFGKAEYGSDNIRWGIYQRRKNNGRTSYCRMKFYFPKNPRSGPQQSWRAVFIAGMNAWAVLTDEQKEVYNQRARKYRMHGVNLFMKEWLKSN